MSSGTSDKAILISSGAADVLTRHVASLELPRRACSLPVEPETDSPLPSFIELWGEADRLRQIVESWPVAVRAWLVAEHVPLAYDRTWPSGAPSPGIRMISSIHRRDGMSRAEFAAYWLGPHTEVAQHYTVPVWHYNQNVVIESLTSDAGEDGFVGMHFRSAEQLRARWQDHPRQAAAGAKDAANFMAVDRSLSITAVETVWDTASQG